MSWLDSCHLHNTMALVANMSKTLPRLSRFVHCLETPAGACLYNAANLKRIYGNSVLSTIYEAMRSRTTLDISSLNGNLYIEMLRKDMLVYGDGDEDELVRKLRNTALRQIHVDNVFIYLTEDCNVQCSYCYVRRNRKKRRVAQTMNVKTALQTVRFIEILVKQRSLQEIYIVFYGGEPLLNWDSLVKIVESINNSSILKRCDVRFRVITNGSLITQENVEFIKRNRIIPSISVDGPYSINEKVRRRPKQWRSAEFTAIRLLEEKGMEYELSVTASSANIPLFPIHLEKLTRTLHPCSIRINVPEAFEGVDRNQFLKDCANLSHVWIQAFDVLHRNHIPATNLGFGAFADKKPRYFPCAGSGRRLVISPRGKIGSCESFVSREEHLLGTVWDNPELLNTEEILVWQTRSGFNIPECYDCISLGLCAGGCAYNAEMLSGQFFARDESICDVARATVRAFLNRGIELIGQDRDPIAFSHLQSLMTPNNASKAFMQIHT